MCAVQTCDCNVIHKNLVDKVKDTLPAEKDIQKLASMFKAFGDPTRAKIIFSLLEDEMCVCDISATLDMTQSAISHQLRVLKNTDLVKSRKDGKIVYYSLYDDHVKEMFNFGLIHLGHLE